MQLPWIGMLTFSLVVSFSAHANNSSDPTNDDWSKAHVNRAFLKDYLEKTQPCYKSPKSFLGCVELINAIGETTIPRVRLTVATKATSADLQKTFGPYALIAVEAPVPRPTSLDEQAARLTNFADIQAVWVDKERPVDFVKLAFDLLPKSTVGESQVIGESLQKLILVHDFHGGLTALTGVGKRHPAGFDSQEDSDGIGVLLDDDGTTVYVQLVYDKSPAQKAGVQTGDEILAVNGSSTINMDSGEVAGRTLGKPGTAVQLEVRRANGARKVFNLVRASNDSPSVVTHVVNDMGQPVLHIALSSFLDSATWLMLETDILSHPEVKAIVIDLRGNVGGIEEQALSVANLFLGPQVIYEKRQISPEGLVVGKPQIVRGEGQAITQKPIAVLIDGGTSSAAEIVAGALQDHKRAWIVGVRSYGKGTIQKIVKKNARLLEASTVMEYFLPSGRSIQSYGIKPDFAVERSLIPTSTKTTREEDFQPFALPPYQPNDENLRQADIDRLDQACLKTQKRADTLYTEKIAQELPVDRQLYAAEEILFCN